MNPRQLKHSEIPTLREEILKEQNGYCPICKGIIREYEAALDHEHKKKIKGTGQIRGVLCRSCNVFLGKLENNCRRYRISRTRLPNFLMRISNYLREEHKPLIHPSERIKEPKLQLVSYNKLRKIYSGKAKFPEYPKSGKLTIKLKALFEQYGIEPKFYSKQ